MSVGDQFTPSDTEDIVRGSALRVGQWVTFRDRPHVPARVVRAYDRMIWVTYAQHGSTVAQVEGFTIAWAGANLIPVRPRRSTR